MTTTDVSNIARHLFATRGSQAIAEAAQKADGLAKAGKKNEATMWRRVESVLREMRGPRQG